MTENKELQDHADKLGKIITQQANKRLQLENRIEELEEKIGGSVAKEHLIR